MIFRSSYWFRRLSPAILLAVMLSLALPGQALSWANGQPATRVLGQPDFTSQGTATAYSMSKPAAVAIDPTSGKLFVLDTYLNRVMRFASPAGLANGSPAEAVIGQADFHSDSSGSTQTSLHSPTGLTVDASGRLWVADSANNRVLRFDNAASIPTGAGADGVLGQPDFTTNSSALSQSGLNNPAGLAVDSAGRLWVADTNNRRVLRFDAPIASSAPGGDRLANGVLGKGDFTTNDFTFISQSRTNNPTDLAVDSSGRLWVSDDRILRFDNAASKANGADADGVLGQPDFTTQNVGVSRSNISTPHGLAVDSAGALWVVDANANRVLRFDSAYSKNDGAQADGLLGQADYISNGQSNDQNGMDGPDGLTTDSGGHLWVADANNSRVLRFDTPLAASTDGSFHSANGVLGQYVFQHSSFLSGAEVLRAPFALAVDPTSGKLFVADTASHRVLRFANSMDFANGVSAEAVLGQPDLSEATPGTSLYSLQAPMGLAVDNAGRLWVADTGNNRVLRFDNAASKPNGALADGLLGQSSFTSSSPGLDEKSMSMPAGVAVDSAGHVWVFDQSNNRVLRFDNAASKTSNGASADGVLGQSDFTHNPPGLDLAHLSQPQSGAVDAQGRLWIADRGNNRVLRFDNAAAKGNGANPDGVLGQKDFSSTDTTFTAATMAYPYGVAVDDNGRLWVADSGHFRVLRFDNAASKPNGADADGLLGLPDFTSLPQGNLLPTQNTLFLPQGLALDGNNRLWIADTFANRILLFRGPQAAITRSDTTPTLGRTVNFYVTFETGVSGLSAANFTATATGSLTHATVTQMSKASTGSSSALWGVTVTATGVAGDVELEMVNSSGVVDAYGNPVDGLPTTASPTYTVLSYQCSLPLISK